ncbi:PadR family transcriptional regulator [Mycobacterium sp. CPCC 205710]|uniref:PadR family transcriptional regulator n=2 Tax=Mycobacterium deserti TaxID=2978347 RepID=A0ABT2M5B3_9MYCO|nr:PadR family transcriptional regulator [Mycobacterium deserti]
MFAILLVLHADSRHGYAIMHDVETLTEGGVTLGPATLYRSLQRLRVDGLIEELDEEVSTHAASDRRAERRRIYRITTAGRAAARAEADRLSAMVAAARRVGVLSSTNRHAS